MEIIAEVLNELKETNRLLRVIASNTEKSKLAKLKLGEKVFVNGEWVEDHDLGQKE